MRVDNLRISKLSLFLHMGASKPKLWAIKYLMGISYKHPVKISHFGLFQYLSYCHDSWFVGRTCSDISSPKGGPFKAYLNIILCIFNQYSMLHSSDINDIVNAKWQYILSDEGHLPRPLLPPIRGQINNPKMISHVPGGIPHLAGVWSCPFASQVMGQRD